MSTNTVNTDIVPEKHVWLGGEQADSAPCAESSASWILLCSWLSSPPQPSPSAHLPTLSHRTLSPFPATLSGCTESHFYLGANDAGDTVSHQSMLSSSCSVE